MKTAEFFVDAVGRYRGQMDAEYGLAQGWAIVPSPPHDAAMQWNGSAWAADRGTLVDRCWEAIKAERDRRRLEGGVHVGGHWYLSSDRAAGEYTSLALLAVGLPDDTVLRAAWRTMDGATVDMTPQLVRQILAAGFTAIAAIDDAAMTHKANMEASPAPATYDFRGGWPTIYGE